ncbi:MAG: hypothetical protein A2Y33_15880 [Spirochaetes bacterium GWF1_51_8]|nr:MAG: hypothetical protein A2Y33_15880 [Spirochaetes bacterium GWF1_51_8]
MKRTVLFAALVLTTAFVMIGCSVPVPGDGDPNQTVTGPTITLTSPAEGFISTNSNVLVSGTSSDADGVLGTYLIIDALAAKKIGTTSFSTNLVLDPGAHVLKIYAYDGQANSSLTNIRNVTVSISGADSTPPVLAVVKPALSSTVYSSNQVNVSGTASDSKSGVEGVYLSVNSGLFVRIGGVTFTTNLSFLNNTTNLLKVYAKDVSNNYSATNSYTAIISIGFTGPNFDFELWTGSSPDSWTNSLSNISAVNFTTIAQSANGAGYGGTGYAAALSQTAVSYPAIWNITEIPVTPGDQVIVKYYAKMTAGTPRCATFMAFYSGTNQTGYISKYYGATYILDGSWKEVYTVHTIGNGTNYMYAGIEGGSSSFNGTFLVDSMIAGVISDLDSANPVIDTWTTPAESNTQIIGSVGFSGTVSDDVAVKYVYAALGNVTNMAVPATGTFTVNLNYLTTGTNITLYLWAEDFAGNFSTVLTRTITLTNLDVSSLPEELFISGYYESAPLSRKAIAIYNPKTNAVSLNAYKLHKGVNGAAWPGTVLTLSNYSIPAGGVFVVGSADSTNHFTLNITNTTYANWNGDDAVGLSKNDVMIDTFGQFGSDPGTGWAVAGVANATVDHVIIRKYMVTIGTNDWAVAAGTDASSSQWQVYNINADEWRMTNHSCVKPQ